MSQRIGEHLRSNVVGYVAIFLFAISGTAYAVDGPLAGTNTVGSEDVINNDLRSEDIGSGNIQTSDIGGGAVTSGKIANGGVLSVDVNNNSLTGDDIANVERAVDIPLAAFVACNPSGAAQIPGQDTGDDTNANPSYNSDGFRRLTLVWDDDESGPDLVPVCTSVRVPDDYAGGGEVVLTGVQVGGSGDDDWQVEFLRNSAGSAEDQFPTILPQNDCEGTNVYACSVSLGTTFTPGDMLTLGIQRVNSSPDETRLLGVHFLYTATS